MTTKIQDGTVVSLAYRVSAQGTVVQSNVGDEPLTYTHGEGQMPPALEEALEGLRSGDQKEIHLTAENAYGEVRGELFETLPLSAVPEAARKKDTMLSGHTQEGDQIRMRVHEIGEANVVVDLNHPLAGKDLDFEIVVLEVEHASEQQ